jgi:light-regulated signal transduction histidine kinase (bacteriophytochrome)
LKRQAENLREAHDELEARVEERTLELAAANRKLHTEVVERQRAEEYIRKINADLEHRVSERTTELAVANQELEAFTYSVAHDLQAPLRNIQSYALLLEEELAATLPPDTAQYLRRISARGKYMGQLISGLLNLSTIGKQELNRQCTELGALVEEVVALLKAETTGRQIDWKIQALPAEACDPHLMKQVFANLLSNAAKYTQARPDAVIEVGQVSRDGVDGERPIFVRDNGVGFNMKNAGKLFGVFQRLHPGGDFEGTGIGLATVARIISKHGGRVWAEAEEKKGATFYFTIGKSSDSCA